jgi:prepilin-type N-terminal cleavage/methylation domain-containing protein
MRVPRRSDRRGLTLVELLMALLLVAILAGASVPIYSGATKRAEAARVIADAHVVSQALREYHFRQSRYPATAALGEVPPELVPHLPDGFRFAYGPARYRFRNWGQGGAPRARDRRPARPAVGLEIHSPDQAFLRALAGVSLGRATLVSGSSLTLVLD